MRFEGSENYVATPDLMLAVNAAIRLQRPLLIKGEPGTGKVLVIDGGGSLRCALLGDQLADMAVKNGWEGVVVYG